MAKTTLPTNYVDDVLNGAMDGKRRYREIPNADGTISLEDATTYDQIGNNFGASQLNLMNDNINQSFDANKMLKTMDEVNAVTQEGYGVDALVVKELNSSLTVERVVLNTQTYSGSKDISIEGNVPTDYKLLLASVDIVGNNTRKVTYSLHYTDEQYSVYGLTNDSACSCTITVYGLCVKNK